MSSLYKDQAAKAKILAYYDRAQSRMGAPCTDLTLPTRFGDTHLLVAGPEDGRPVVILHGGNVVNPISLSWFAPLMQEFRIYAPDTIGHPGKSAETKLSGKDESYGQWLVDLLDGLGLEKASFVGPSFGGGMILRLAAYAPERIARAALIHPASLAMSLTTSLRDIVWPMLLYKLAPSPERLLRSVQPMFTEAVDPEMLEFVSDVYRHVKIHPGMPKTATREALARFTAPTMLVAAEQDVFFPAHLIVPQARKVLPNLVETHLLEGSGHYPSRAGEAQIIDWLRPFLSA